MKLKFMVWMKSIKCWVLPPLDVAERSDGMHRNRQQACSVAHAHRVVLSAY